MNWRFRCGVRPIRHIHPSIVALSLFLFALCAGPVVAETIGYTFQVQADARMFGTFGDLGTATMQFTPERDAGFRVSGTGTVMHPLDSAVIYRYELDMHFQLRGNEVRILSKHNTSNKAGETIVAAVEEIVPFVYLSQVLPSSSRGYTLSAAGSLHTLTYTTGIPQEVSLKRGPRELAHFYVQPASPRNRLLRFRINRRSGANLMFVPR